MAIKLPDFLNKAYLEKVLQKHENESIRVQDFDCKPAVAAGNNYASLLLRVNVKYIKNAEDLEKSLIIKTVVADAEMAKMVIENGIYQKELVMYDRILPKFQNLLTSHGDTEQLFSPAVFVDHERCTLIFDDLKQSGYTLANRLTGVDEKHVDLLIRKIAKFHACSMVLSYTGSENFKEFQESPFKDDDLSGTFMGSMYGAFLSQIRTWTGYEKYLVKLEKLQARLIKQTLEVFSESKFPIKVLSHGDLWTNNMMFRYNKDKTPSDLLLIDFQVGYVGAAVVDLMYFTLTSTTNEIKLNKFPEILSKYHKNLVQCLKQLEFEGKVPTLFELHSQYIEKSFYEVMAVTVISVVMLNEQQDNADLGSLMTNTKEAKQFREQMYKSERFIKTVKHLLPIWDQMGLLDPLH